MTQELKKVQDILKNVDFAGPPLLSKRGQVMLYICIYLVLRCKYMQLGHQHHQM
jgi:hypothetical protein